MDSDELILIKTIIDSFHLQLIMMRGQLVLESHKIKVGLLKTYFEVGEKLEAEGACRNKENIQRFILGKLVEQCLKEDLPAQNAGINILLEFFPKFDENVVFESYFEII